MNYITAAVLSFPTHSSYKFIILHHPHFVEGNVLIWIILHTANTSSLRFRGAQSGHIERSLVEDDKHKKSPPCSQTTLQLAPSAENRKSRCVSGLRVGGNHNEREWLILLVSRLEWEDEGARNYDFAIPYIGLFKKAVKFGSGRVIGSDGVYCTGKHGLCKPIVMMDLVKWAFRCSERRGLRGYRYWIPLGFARLGAWKCRQYLASIIGLLGNSKWIR